MVVQVEWIAGGIIGTLILAGYIVQKSTTSKGKSKSEIKVNQGLLFDKKAMLGWHYLRVVKKDRVPGRPNVYRIKVYPQNHKVNQESSIPKVIPQAKYCLILTVKESQLKNYIGNDDIENNSDEIDYGDGDDQVLREKIVRLQERLNAVTIDNRKFTRMLENDETQPYALRAIEKVSNSLNKSKGLGAIPMLPQEGEQK